MTKRKERAQIELGSCRMQGPVEEIDYVSWSNTVSSAAKKGFSRHSLSKKVHKGAESGQCNVCSTPCTTCMHFNRALMGSKMDLSSDGTCHQKAASQYSNCNGCALPPFRSSGDEQRTTSEMSNLFSVNSSHDSFSENAESKQMFIASDISDASEDIEMLPKLSSGGGARRNGLPSEQKCVSDQAAFSNKHVSRKSLEGHDDNISGASGTDDAHIVVANYCHSNVDKKNISGSSASVSSLGPEKLEKTISHQTDSSCVVNHCDFDESGKNTNERGICTDKLTGKVLSVSSSNALLQNKLDVSDHPPSEDGEKSTGLRKSRTSRSRINKDLSSGPCLKDFGEDPNSNLGGELPENSTQKSSLDIASGQTPADNSENNSSLDGSNHDETMKGSPKLETASDTGKQHLPGETFRSPDQVEQVENISGSVPSPDLQERAVDLSQGAESDESDMVEHDVKVCDICGDAGREDLLAICSKCSDGAEHTYCMREMLLKVPEGYWLCEECKFEEEIENQRQDKCEAVHEREKNKPSCHTSTVDSDQSRKLDKKESDLEGDGASKAMLSARGSFKRQAEDIEDVSAAKRQAVETTIGSPKICNPSSVGALSRDCSFKNFETGKVKPVHQSSLGQQLASEVGDSVSSPAGGPRLQTPRGTLSKSNSFSTLNSRGKVKPVDEAIIPKQKLGRDTSLIDSKEGAVMGKSMSFKYANSGRVNEAKVKMLSSNFSHALDMKGSKQGKERALFEKKSSFKSDPSSIAASSNVSITKVDRKLSSRGEAVVSSVGNNHDTRVGQADGKLATSSKSTSHFDHKGSENLAAKAESKRFSNSSSVVGSPSANGSCISSVEIRAKVSSKDEPSPTSSYAVDKSNNSSASLPDGLPQSRESLKQAEKTKESSSNQSRQSTNAGGKSIPCHKCKEFGHAAQFCANDSTKGSVVVEPSVKIEMSPKSNKLKAAIQAAMLKKPGICRKNRVSDRSEELSISSADLSSESRNRISAEGTLSGQAVPGNSTADSYKQALRKGEPDSFVSSDGKFSMRDFSNPTPATSVISKMLPIPEQEYIWQGDFEVHRVGKPLYVCGGIQAHLSTCASPKVLEVVNKFPCKVLLNEVSRLSTWPQHFQESGAHEDNIALYFFAKDKDSYDRNYKTLLDTMMANDLALKGNLDGVELLIFPSDQLPAESRRWNLLFFLWGVFRARRVNCLEDPSGSSKKLDVSNLNVTPVETTVLSMHEDANVCGNLDDNSPAHDRSCTSKASTASDTHSSADTVNGNSESNTNSEKQIHSHVNLEEKYRIDHPFAGTYGITPQSGSEVRCSSIDRKDHITLDDELETSKESSQEARMDSAPSKNEKMPRFVNLLGSASNSIKALCTGNQEDGVKENFGDYEIDRSIFGRKETKADGNSEESRLVNTEPLVGELQTRDRSLEVLNNGELNHRKRLNSNCSNMMSQIPSISPTMPWGEIKNSTSRGESVSKKLKTDFSGTFDTSKGTNLPIDIYASKFHNVRPCSLVEDMRCDEDVGATERFFFPVETCRVKDVLLRQNSTPWQSVQDVAQVQDGVPDLELALGGERKSPKPGVRPLFIDLEAEDDNQAKPQDTIVIKDEEEEDDSASLSLSLSFPFSEEERTRKRVPKREELMSERHHVQ
ncbi:hypothetical protein RJ641_033535, partial [Dillenia turbinata]